MQSIESFSSGQIILHVLTSVQHGGAERVVLELAQRQRQQGADARVLCVQQRGDLAPAFEAAGVPVALVPGDGRAGAVRMAWRTARVLNAVRPLVVHTHNAAPQILAGLGQKLRHWRRPGDVLVHTEHGRLHDLRRGLLRWRRWTVAEFDVVTAVSADARDQMLEHGIRADRGVDVVLNGVDVTRFTPRSVNGASGRRIVHVGRLADIKGQDVLVAAMPWVRAAVTGARLTIVGDGPTRPALEAQARQLGVDDVIEFVGAASDVRSYLGAADLFVLPSRSEGISIALLEAMASGLGVVATDVGGNREVIDPPTAGTLVSPDDPRALADAIIDSLTSADGLRAKAAAARQLVEARFSSKRTVAAYAALYHEAAQARRAAAGRSAA